MGPSRALVALRARVRRTLADRALLGPGAGVLVACSGGPDSAGLLIVLHALAPTLRLRLEVATVDHGLRAGSRADAEVACAQAAALGLTAHRLTLRPDAWGRRDGPRAAGAAPLTDLQARARVARYAALRECARERGLDRIAVGHTLDDQAETVLLRLLRGAGLRGLAAIAPRRADGVIRPLIDCERAEVHRVALESGLPIATDPSNEDLRFARVRLRRAVWPALLAEDGAVARHLARVADDVRAARAVLEAAGGRALARARREASLEAGDEHAWVLSRAALCASPGAVRRAALGRLVRQAGLPGLSRAQIEALDRAVVDGRGRVWLGGGLVAEAGRAHLRVATGNRRVVRRETGGAGDIEAPADRSSTERGAPQPRPRSG